MLAISGLLFSCLVNISLFMYMHGARDLRRERGLLFIFVRSIKFCHSCIVHNHVFNYGISYCFRFSARAQSPARANK